MRHRIWTLELSNASWFHQYIVKYFEKIMAPINFYKNPVGQWLNIRDISYRIDEIGFSRVYLRMIDDRELSVEFSLAWNELIINSELEYIGCKCQRD